MKIKKKGVINLERWNIHVGDCQLELKKIEPESVQTVVTSPPYWGLRDYSTATWEGGDEECDHTVSHWSDNLKPHVDRPFRGDRSSCLNCGAKRIDLQIGLEPTPKEYCEDMVAVFRQVGRVLRKDGTVWLNLGDSYGSGTTNSPKNLVGIPWRVAFALQADGWYLRSDIIWNKPNPMPESVQDRPTKSHEYIFLLSKSPHYYYDADAIREKAIEGTDLGLLRGASFVDGQYISAHAPTILVRKESGIDSKTAGSGYRNKRDVWTVNTKPFPEAHFATFPEKLIDTCIKAGSKKNDIVLDPFSGAGTTGVVACKLNRIYIGIELNPDYAEMSKNRLARTVGATEEQAKEMDSDGVQGSLL